MKYLDITLEDPAENLALDEALLLQRQGQADDDPAKGGGEILRIWEPQRPMIVIGRSSKIAEEVDLARCREDQIPVLRRISGGASVVLGPGCLVFSVIISFRERPELISLDQSHCLVLGTLAAALGRYADNIIRQGTSDLALRDRAPDVWALRDKKFSGNSMSRKRDTMLYHGTLLYDFPLRQISRYLHLPDRQPDYRKGRDHELFVTNFPCDRGRLKMALMDAFSASEELREWPSDAMRSLALTKYGCDRWNDQR